eukprot:scaffold12113_cov159-Amphora_coffeaeformis.AAC.3
MIQEDGQHQRVQTPSTRTFCSSCLERQDVQRERMCPREASANYDDGIWSPSRRDCSQEERITCGEGHGKIQRLSSCVTKNANGLYNRRSEHCRRLSSIKTSSRQDVLRERAPHGLPRNTVLRHMRTLYLSSVCTRTAMRVGAKAFAAVGISMVATEVHCSALSNRFLIVFSTLREQTNSIKMGKADPNNGDTGMKNHP